MPSEAAMKKAMQAYFDHFNAGDVEAVVSNGRNKHGHGLIISSSRAILYAGSGSDFADAARAATQKLRDDIERYR